MKSFRILMLGLALALPARAQPAADERPAPTPAESRVREIVSGDGIHVVHLWAPWCRNSVEALKSGWYEVIEEHPDVTFTFVTIWNNGRSGREAMYRYAIPERVLELVQPDFGDSADDAKRRRSFLGMPVHWTPTTWIFHRNGRLAYAFNYGEVDAGQLRAALAAARKDWSHE